MVCPWPGRAYHARRSLIGQHFALVGAFFRRGRGCGDAVRFRCVKAVVVTTPVCSTVCRCDVSNAAVDYLKVKHIIVCGHYDCGGVRAASTNQNFMVQLGPLTHPPTHSTHRRVERLACVPLCRAAPQPCPAVSNTFSPAARFHCLRVRPGTCSTARPRVCARADAVAPGELDPERA